MIDCYAPKTHDVAQRSQEWYDLRMGVVTASQVKRIIGAKGGEETYINELISQKLTYKYKEIYMTDAIQHGVDYESQAISAYSFITNNRVDQVGFVKCHEYLGCSPDGFIGEDGLIETKCPDTHTHIGWVRNNKIPKDHIYQCLYQLFVTKREWVDFVSYDPRLSSPHNLFIKRCTISEYQDDYDRLLLRLEDFLSKYTAAIGLFEN